MKITIEIDDEKEKKAVGKDDLPLTDRDAIARRIVERIFAMGNVAAKLVVTDKEGAHLGSWDRDSLLRPISDILAGKNSY